MASDFQTQVDRSGLPILVIFTTPTCAPCKVVKATLARELPQQDFWLVDAEKDHTTAAYYNVASVSTTMLFRPNLAPVQATGTAISPIIEALRPAA